LQALVPDKTTPCFTPGPESWVLCPGTGRVAGFRHSATICFPVIIAISTSTIRAAEWNVSGSKGPSPEFQFVAATHYGPMA
ncbi:hypothetical protein M5D96_011861, partial [Drosophila gunungcola]